MLHDVTVEVYDPGRGSYREVVQVDAMGGDDAASMAAVEAARFSAGRTWRIIAVVPSAPVEAAPLPLKGKKPRPAPVAVPEGDDFPDDPDA